MSRVVHFDLMSGQPDRLAEFCIKAFGWTVVKWDGPMEYWLAGTGDRSKAGMTAASAAASRSTRSYLPSMPPTLTAPWPKRSRPAPRLCSREARFPVSVGMPAVQAPDGNLFGLMQEDPAAK